MQAIARWKLPLIVVAGVLFMFGTMALAVRLTGGHLINIQDDSMAPVLNRGDLAIASDVPIASVKNGDLIAVPNPKSDSQIVAHRVVGTPSALGAHNFQTMGDNNPSPEAFTTADQVMGKINYRIPLLGNVINFVSWTSVIITTLAVAALAIGAIELRMLWHRHKDQQLEQSYMLFGYDHHHFGHR